MNVAPHTYVSLFAGCAGLDLGVHLAVPDARCVLYVERELGAARILASRMEDGSIDAAPIWSDVRTVDGLQLRGRVDGIIGGFPCTDLSVAGKGAGIGKDTRSGLWWEYLRIITEVRPQWVFIENVPPLLGYGNPGDMESDDEADGESADGTFRNFDAVAGPLSEIGFDCEWISLRASDVGAPHRRERVFVMAYSKCNGWRDHRVSRNMEKSQGAQGLTGDKSTPSIANCYPELAHSPLRGLGVRGESSGGGGLADGGDENMGHSIGHDDRRANGTGRGQRQQEKAQGEHGGVRCDAADPGHRLLPQPRRGPQGRDGAGSAGEGNVGDTNQPGSQGWGRDGDRRSNEWITGQGGLPLFPPGPSDAAAWRDILAQWPWLAPAVESGVRLLADDVAVVVDESRADQLRAGGNGVVALQGALAFTILARRAGLDFWGGAGMDDA